MSSAVPAQTGTPASLALRLLAALYDMLPVLALWFVAAVLALAITGGALDVRQLPHRMLVQALLLAFTAAYFAISWRRGGQTIGMRAWRLRIVRADGTPLDTRQALVRFGVSLLSLAAVGLGFWWALFDAQSRTWHDIVAGTVMVRLERGAGDSGARGQGQ
ncbi:MAG TPA: RDD family protein [Rudaea sp.]|nr:RDD family protein [Rudaea sp.]